MKFVTIIAAALLVTAAAPEVALAESHITGDAEKGERVFRKCKACHQVGPEAENKVGPVLNGIVDRAAGSVDDFAYSDTLKQMAADDTVWTPENLDAFLENPREFAKGTKMAFAGLRKESERADVIAYLATFADEGS